MEWQLQKLTVGLFLEEYGDGDGFTFRLYDEDSVRNKIAFLRTNCILSEAESKVYNIDRAKFLYSINFLQFRPPHSPGT